MKICKISQWEAKSLHTDTHRHVWSFDKNHSVIILLGSTLSFPLYSYTFTFVCLAAAFFPAPKWSGTKIPAFEHLMLKSHLIYYKPAQTQRNQIAYRNELTWTFIGTLDKKEVINKQASINGFISTNMWCGTDLQWRIVHGAVATKRHVRPPSPERTVYL